MNTTNANIAPPEIAAIYDRGTQPFMGLSLLVARGALVPRPDTELLGAEAVALLKARPAGPPPVVIDVCCGVGNLACAIAHHIPTAIVFAADLTPACAELSRKNVEQLGLGQRVKVYQGDLFEPLRPVLPATGVDLIVCNPPYISTSRIEGDRATLLEQEPREAFDGGPYGLSIHQRVIKEAAGLLKPGGQLLFEFGVGQERQMKALFDRSRAYEKLRFVSNAEGAPRIAVASRPL